MPLVIPVGERMVGRWEGREAAGGDRTLEGERGDAERPE